MWLIVSIVIATILRFALQFVGQKYVPVCNAAIIMILEPVFTTLAGVIVYLGDGQNVSVVS
ncbi:EamA family transporter [Gilliamella apis]|uniref:EamA family transporter n=1 Tax=Gilliamella apis TaxID=1970738 RepID=UPI0027424511|nr:EamA family transporter [Gilliamella apis]WLT06610.1 EamA family transporter [Gilliamella apis]